MATMSNIKVLPAEWWFIEYSKDEIIEEARYIQCDPRFNRPGIYLDGDFCWFEADGGAWLYDKAYFIYELELLNASSFNHRQVSALKAIVDQKLATKYQIKLLSRCIEIVDRRNMLMSNNGRCR